MDDMVRRAPVALLDERLIARTDAEVRGRAPERAQPPEREGEAAQPPNARGAPDGEGAPDARPAADQPPGPSAEPPEDGRTKARKRWRKRIIIALLFVLALAAIAAYAVYYLTVARYLESTNDAYLQADNAAVAPKITGYVTEVAVTDNQRVKAGDVLARIDDRDYRAALDQAAADVQSAEGDIRNNQAQLVYQQSLIDQAGADLESAIGLVRFSQQELDRYAALAKDGFGSVQRLQQAQADIRDKNAAVTKMRAALEAARRQLDVIRTQQGRLDGAVARDRAVLAQARLNLEHTILQAPTDGEIGDRAARVGEYVQPGTQLMTVVPVQATYLVANFKETQLEHMVRGEHATVSVDAYPSDEIDGVIDSLAPGSGAQFSLLPPENATGNFTKIVQRVPVKIMLDAGNPLFERLRPGLSVGVTIDARTAPKDGRPLITYHP